MNSKIWTCLKKCNRYIVITTVPVNGYLSLSHIEEFDSEIGDYSYGIDEVRFSTLIAEVNNSRSRATFSVIDHSHCMECVTR